MSASAASPVRCGPDRRRLVVNTELDARHPDGQRHQRKAETDRAPSGVPPESGVTNLILH
jgi:hypothetical protein